MVRGESRWAAGLGGRRILNGPEAQLAAKAEVGFEPTNNGFAIRPLGSATDSKSRACGLDAGRLGALLGALRAENPDLANVIDAWPKRPDVARAGILAMVEAVGGEGG